MGERIALAEIARLAAQPHRMPENFEHTWDFRRLVEQIEQIALKELRTRGAE
jgi:hypothetical protein